MKRLTIEWRVKPSGPNYAFLPPKDTAWTRYERVSAKWAKRRLTQLRRTIALRSSAGLPRRVLFQFRFKPEVGPSPKTKHKG
jgi:hypothetical protein